MFISQKGGRLTSNAIWKVIKKYGSRVGQTDLTPHSLRHTFGTMLIRKHKVDIVTTVALWGMKILLRRRFCEPTIFYIGKEDEIMCYSQTYIQIEKLFNKYGFEKLIIEPRQVTGGLMHKMYQVITEHKKYAVKELNSSIMQRKGVPEHIVNSERIANALVGIIPVVAAMQFNDGPLLMLDKQYYMVFDWIDGVSIFPPYISSKNCMKIGTLLGKMHSADIMVSGMHKETNKMETYEWNKYLQLGHETNAEWIQDLSQMIDKLKRWSHETYEAYNSLNDFLVLSHRDLDPKNVMWKDDNPYIIDWEAAGYVNPYQELLEVLTYWANNGNGKLDKEKFEALYHAYKTVVGSCQVNWETVITSGFSGMLGWLNYSFKRSLGIEGASLEEKKLGTEQAFGTMESFENYSDADIKEYFIDKFLSKSNELVRRCIFLKDLKKGIYVGTCCAWMGEKENKVVPVLHWLAVRSGFENKRYARMLVTEVMKIFKNLDVGKSIYLHTQPCSYKAIKLYSDFGFCIAKHDTYGSAENECDEALEILKKYMQPVSFTKIKESLVE